MKEPGAPSLARFETWARRTQGAYRQRPFPYRAPYRQKAFDNLRTAPLKPKDGLSGPPAEVRHPIETRTKRHHAQHRINRRRGLNP